MNIPAFLFPYALASTLLLGAFLAYRELYGEHESLKQASLAPGDAPESLNGAAANLQPLEIVIGEGEPFERVEPAGASMRRTISVGIRNVAGRRLSRCQVQITRIIPPPPTQPGPWALGEAAGFNLQPFETRYLDLVAYDEVRPPGAAQGQIMVYIPYAGGFFDTMLTLPNDTPSVLYLRVVSPDSRERGVGCKAWVDETGRLRLTQC